MGRRQVHSKKYPNVPGWRPCPFLKQKSQEEVVVGECGDEDIPSHEGHRVPGRGPGSRGRGDWGCYGLGSAGRGLSCPFAPVMMELAVYPGGHRRNETAEPARGPAGLVTVAILGGCSCDRSVAPGYHGQSMDWQCPVERDRSRAVISTSQVAGLRTTTGHERRLFK